MKMKNIYFQICINILLFISISLILSSNQLFKTYSLVIKLIYIISSVVIGDYFLYLFFKPKISQINYYVALFFYVIILLITLFYRKEQKEYLITDGFYIIKWLKLILINKIVFYNLIGNIILFIPLGFFNKNHSLKYLFIAFIIIILIEFLQYITKRGVFDIIDIVLNIIGVLIGFLLTQKEEK